MMNDTRPESPEALYIKFNVKNQKSITESQPKDRFYLYVECWKKTKFDTIAILSVDETEYDNAYQLKNIRDKINDVILGNQRLKHE